MVSCGRGRPQETTQTVRLPQPKRGEHTKKIGVLNEKLFFQDSAFFFGLGFSISVNLVQMMSIWDFEKEYFPF